MIKLQNILLLLAICLVAVNLIGQRPTLVVGNFSSGAVVRYDAATGSLIDTLEPEDSTGTDIMRGPTAVTFGPDGNLYIASSEHPADLSGDFGAIVRFNGKTGAFIDVFAFGHGMAAPSGLAFGPDGNLYVSQLNPQRGIMRFDGSTGAFIDSFVDGCCAPELVNPAGLTFGPNGDLYVTSEAPINGFFPTGSVVRYDGKTGVLKGIFTGGLFRPHGLVFGPDGNLYVADRTNSRVVRFDGQTGAFLGTFISAGSGSLRFPWGVAFGPDGNLYVSSANGLQAGVLRFNGPDKSSPGTFIDAFTPFDADFSSFLPSGLAFSPSSCLLGLTTKWSQGSNPQTSGNGPPGGGRWGSDTYDDYNPAGSACEVGHASTNCHVERLGCALTSLAMGLKFAGVNDISAPVGLFSTALDPGTLNKFMSHQLFPFPFLGLGGQFSPNHDVLFDATTRFVQGASGKSNLTFQFLGGRNGFDSISNTEDAFKALDDALCVARQPVIVGVTGSDGTFPGHYVLVTGKQPRSNPAAIAMYSIIDPGDHTKTSLDDYLDSFGQPKFVTRGFVKDPSGDRSALDLAVGHIADLLITDSSGRQTGFSADTSEIMDDIPQSAYFKDALDDDGITARALGFTHSVQIGQPLPDNYSVTISGSALGTYTLLINPFSQDGTPQPALSLVGVAGIGSRSFFTIHFASGPGSVSTAERVTTFQNMLDDISNSLQLGLIDNKGIANSLSKKLVTAKNAMGEARTNILRSFKNEVDAQSGKHIIGVLPQVLIEDAESLINQNGK
jgi:DNA-binding beta-propeller fold protein YncE